MLIKMYQWCYAFGMWWHKGNFINSSKSNGDMKSRALARSFLFKILSRLRGRKYRRLSNEVKHTVLTAQQSECLGKLNKLDEIFQYSGMDDYRFYGDKEKTWIWKCDTVSIMFGSIINNKIVYKVDSENSFYYEVRVRRRVVISLRSVKRIYKEYRSW